MKSIQRSSLRRHRQELRWLRQVSRGMREWRSKRLRWFKKQNNRPRAYRLSNLTKRLRANARLPSQLCRLLWRPCKLSSGARGLGAVGHELTANLGRTVLGFDCWHATHYCQIEVLSRRPHNA